MNPSHHPRLLAVLLTGILATGLTLTGSILPAHAADGVLSGTVTEVGTGAPLGGVAVQAFCWQVPGTDPGELCGTTQTAADGTYSMSLAPGIYKVSFDDWPDHAVKFYGGGTHVGDPSSTPVSVPSGGNAAGVNAALQRLWTVSGTVTASADGVPVGGINVTAYQLSAGPSPSWEPGGGAVTESDGTYALHLTDGTYRVGFSDAHGPYSTVFYDGAATVGAADDVVVGADVQDIDAELGLNHPITGGVTVDGVDMPGVTVTAYQADASAPGGWEAVKVAETGADGSYALYLPDGTYRVEFTTWQGRFPTVYYPSAPTIGLGSDVVVAGAEVPDINAAIVSGDVDTGPAIRGTVTLAGGGGPIAGVSVSAWRFDAVFGSWVQVRVRSTGPDGTYALHVPEGTYRVGFTDFRARYQAVFYGGAAAVEDAADVVQVTAGVTGIDAELVENPRVSGDITADPLPDQPAGPPPTLVTAWRWDEAALEWLPAGEAFSGIDGHYDLYAPDGTYRLEFEPFTSGYEVPYFYGGADNIGEASDIVLDGADVTGIDAHLVAAPLDPPPTWTSAWPLSTAGRDAWDPRVAVGPRGAALAVWSHRGASGGRVQASYRRTTGSWGRPVFLSPRDQDAVDPRVAIAGDGTHVVVWRRWDGARYRVVARTRSLTGDWSAPTTISAPGADAWDPQVAVGHDRAAVVVWRSTDGAGSEVRASTLGAAGTWSSPTKLSGDVDAWDPQVAVATDGTGVVVWSRAGAHDRVQAVTLSRDGHWSSRSNLSAPERDAEDPQAAIAPSGTATVVWRSSASGSERVQASRLRPGRGWSEPANLSTAGRDAHDPQVAMEPGGTVTAVWARWDGSTDRVQASTLVPGAPWSTPETLSRGGLDATVPEVAAGPDGKATVVWQQSGESGGSVQAAIWIPGWTWSVPTPLTNGAVSASRPQVAVGADGTVAAVWERRIDNDDRVEVAVRFDPGGPEHCRNENGVDVNVVFGVPEQLVVGPCRTVNARAAWRPVTFWSVNTAFEQVPPGFVPAGATPLEDLVAKLTSVTVVVDPGTDAEKTVVFSPDEALHTDRFLRDWDPSQQLLPIAATLPRMGRLPAGKHVARMFWTLSAEHCDGLGDVPAYNCLPSGTFPLWTHDFRVRSR